MWATVINVSAISCSAFCYFDVWCSAQRHVVIMQLLWLASVSKHLRQKKQFLFLCSGSRTEFCSRAKRHLWCWLSCQRGLCFFGGSLWAAGWRTQRRVLSAPLPEASSAIKEQTKAAARAGLEPMRIIWCWDIQNRNYMGGAFQGRAVLCLAKKCTPC